MNHARVDERLAIVMITHDRREEVVSTLARLRQLPEQPHIVLVDNASADGTHLAVSSHFPDIEIIVSPSNLGAAGRNLGVRAVTTPYVAFCDDDTWWDPGSLQRAADLFDAYPRMAVATGRVLVGPDNVEDPICKVLAESPVPAEADLPGPPLLGFLAGASVIRRSAFLEVGGFEPRFVIGGEEEIIAIDLAVHGWGLCYLPDLVVHHHPSLRRDGECREWMVLRNALWASWLRRPLISAVRRTVWEIQRRRGKQASISGIVSALAGLPWVLAHRRVVPDDLERMLRLLDAHGSSSNQPALAQVTALAEC